MTEEATTSVWREALTNRGHELYAAAWTVFTHGIALEAAMIRLEDQKEQVIPFLLAILEDDYLQTKQAPGDGNAPLNATRLLGEWGVHEALPHLLTIIEESVRSQPIYLNAVQAINKMGPEVLKDVLAWVEENPELQPEAVDMLAKIGEGNEQVFELVRSWITPDGYMLEIFSESLIEIDPSLAADALRQLSQDRDFDKDNRAMFRAMSKEAKETLKQRLKEEAEAAEAAAVEAETETEIDS